MRLLTCASESLPAPSNQHTLILRESADERRHWKYSREVDVFCPNCRAEYREGFNHCSDCQVELVERAPNAPERIVTATSAAAADLVVFDTLDQFSAAQLCTFLEAHGIPARMHGPTLVNPYDVGGAAGIVQVLVPEESAAVARELLARADAGEFRSGTLQ